ncbi:hypothetical protein KJ877_04970 [bacterium]|nr:hypothetical protein [bacterium]MBU1989621.1 hypothetical protein [bacterium]
MSALTKNERDGLEDVFMSIHSHNEKYKKLKELSTLIMSKSNKLSVETLLKRARCGIKETNLSHLFAFLSKKKKPLSK